ncbi:hypothetical protein GOP47_0009191 [Adiantum capillus-veneris]|uniref:Uncharacterized protein n=1 Tax=Adiantum capillus-veneris TaxID=13818 RepID=A0A9D4ZJF2_ADICA|nr:hypothetical protein GOP47_0009191 [Adiantum capillus-veneris]
MWPSPLRKDLRSKGSLHPWSRLKDRKLSERTRGIDVTIIKSQLDHQRISIWDMAGQLEYHSFHDSMLPDLGDLAIPSLFLFVWNPFKTNEKGQLLRDARSGRLVLKRLDDFMDDFKYWLKFLASKIPKSNVLKPNVLVAVTRADLGLPNMKAELQTDFESLQVEFEEYIHLDMEGSSRLRYLESLLEEELISLGHGSKWRFSRTRKAHNN